MLCKQIEPTNLTCMKPGSGKSISWTNDQNSMIKEITYIQIMFWQQQQQQTRKQINRLECKNVQPLKCGVVLMDERKNGRLSLRLKTSWSISVVFRWLSFAWFLRIWHIPWYIASVTWLSNIFFPSIRVFICYQLQYSVCSVRICSLRETHLCNIYATFFPMSFPLCVYNNFFCSLSYVAHYRRHCSKCQQRTSIFTRKK